MKKKKKFENLVDKNSLLNFLNPTSRGTHFRDSPPSSQLKTRQIGRIILQFHQIISLFKQLNIKLENKIFLDVGTGNGMIPKLISKYTKVKYTEGIDPFLDGEHTTSWQEHDHNSEFFKITKKINSLVKKKNKEIIFEKYSKSAKYEPMSFQPIPIKLELNKKVKYKFHQLDVAMAGSLKKKYDIVYFKALEHISNINKIFKEMNKITKKKSIIYFKHRSFFSYLGPHRYASTFIPWGHVYLSDKEMIKYVKTYHKDRAEKILNFYFKELSYPRFTVNELIKTASDHNFVLKVNIVEPFKKLNKSMKYLRKNKNFWKKVYKNYPKLASDELFSGMHHIILEKK